jgi:hypothetical protein
MQKKKKKNWEWLQKFYEVLQSRVYEQTRQNAKYIFMPQKLKNIL